ncbi:CRISPR-associated helicase Cas3 family [gamma proteobacterium BDW918]|nr:CRISPR-associated helicase Cas3 family [gamma proteobacterium BDW918]
MMVTFISQCDKKAIARSRRVLDAFADRIGDNTWQTVITQEGLLAVKKLLRKTATKNTAVSCHWIRSRARSELIWVVGNRNKFNYEGGVPVNTTLNDSYSAGDENRWIYGHAIQIVAVLAALLHDIGKATVGFQNKLFSPSDKFKGDPYRHEWISLRLFQAMIYGCNTDEQWLSRVMDFDSYIQGNPDWLKHLPNDDEGNPRRLDKLPPLAQLIAWLVVTHHRLPTYKPTRYARSQRYAEQLNDREWGKEMDMQEFFASLAPYEKWVKNEKADTDKDFWRLKEVVMTSKSWQRELKRWARKARDHAPLMALAQNTISDPLLMHLSRLCLMLADHNYSRLSDPNDKKRVKGDAQFANKLAANTNQEGGIKQPLDEHLLGVASFAKKVALDIPRLSRRLPVLPSKHKPFLAQTRKENYLWQNGAFALATKLQESAQRQGFFGVNMASTGRGKTLANARIMYALASSETGARFTIALGLRVLTLQTGRALRERLSLGEENLAILVGGAANRKLFELAQEEQDFTQSGSESIEPLLGMGEEVDGSLLPEEFQTLLEDSKTQKLLAAPVVSCTVDHIMQASECSRGGRYIAPVLRLLTSDLVLDEPDDFDQSDLPALARLVHMAGLYGSKVLLSSATLTPDMLAGLYQAYSAGRKVWNSHMGVPSAQPIPCAWFDEYHQQGTACADFDVFTSAHQQFVSKREAKLLAEPVRRKAEILPVELPPAKEGERLKIHMPALAKLMLDAAIELHGRHAEACPVTNKQVSIGLIRMANVEPIIHLVRNMYAQIELPSDVHIHLCCYHAKQLLILRDGLEQKLDRILSRSEPKSLFTHTEVQTALNRSSAGQHIFIVVASPVAEVGRDHDYDWAIVEPSSMRSLIQLAGRVWRHRPDKIATSPNLFVMDKNIHGLKGDAVCFTRPGFEQEPRFQLVSHSCSELITQAQLNRIDSIARIVHEEELQPEKRLADLEHAVMNGLLNNTDNFVSAFWRSGNGNHTSAHLQKISPFRDRDVPEDDYVCLPVPEDEHGYKFTFAEAAWKDLYNCPYQTSKIRFAEFSPCNPQVSPWLTVGLDDVVQELADKLGEHNLTKVARQYATVRLAQRDGVWLFHPWLGFWKAE